MENFSTYNITFIHKKNSTIQMDFDKKISTKEMINTFLQKTNSKSFDPKKIKFFHGTNLLNLPLFFNNNIENVFGRVQKITIQIKDLGNIIGGEN